MFGHSGGGPHALACAALLGERVIAAVSVSGMAPYPDGMNTDDDLAAGRARARAR